MFGKNHLLIALSAASLSQISPAFADDEMKALIGGIVGTIMVEGMKEMSKPQEQPAEQIQQDQIQWANPHQDQSTQAAEPNPDRLRIREIQAALTKIGFYYKEIDGVSGSGTTAAIQAWENEFDQTVDGYLTDDEFKFLKTVSEAGFSNHSDYQEAANAGLSTRKEFVKYKQGSLEIKNPKKEIINVNSTLEAEVADTTAPREQKNAEGKQPDKFIKISSGDSVFDKLPESGSRIVKILGAFLALFSVIALFASVKAMITKGHEYGLNFILSFQFFIILFGLPIGYIAAIGPKKVGVMTTEDMIIASIAFMLPISISFLMNLKKSNFIFSFFYTLLQALSLPFFFITIIFLIAGKGIFNELRTPKKFKLVKE